LRNKQIHFGFPTLAKHKSCMVPAQSPRTRNDQEHRTEALSKRSAGLKDLENSLSTYRNRSNLLSCSNEHKKNTNCLACSVCTAKSIPTPSIANGRRSTTKQNHPRVLAGTDSKHAASGNCCGEAVLEEADDPLPRSTFCFLEF